MQEELSSFCARGASTANGQSVGVCLQDGCQTAGGWSALQTVPCRTHLARVSTKRGMSQRLVDDRASPGPTPAYALWQVWHSCGRLLPSLDAAARQAEGWYGTAMKGFPELHGEGIPRVWSKMRPVCHIVDLPGLPWPSQRNLSPDYDCGALSKAVLAKLGIPKL